MKIKTRILFLICFFFGVLLEGTITTLPVVCNILLLWFIVYRDSGIFFLAFVSGLFLDAVLVQQLGVRSLYYIVFIFVVVLYEKKFEIQTVPFVFLSSFLGSFGFLLVIRQQYVVWQALVSAILTAFVFHRIYTVREEE